MGKSAVHWPGMKVGIIDERSEIAGCLRGVPGFDVGPRTDVLDGCPKAEGMMMMIRSMSPDVLIVDEIGRPEDAEAVIEALHAGISVIATAHGSSIQDMRGDQHSPVFWRTGCLRCMPFLTEQATTDHTSCMTEVSERFRRSHRSAGR